MDRGGSQETLSKPAVRGKGLYAKSERDRGSRVVTGAITFLVLFSLWIILSGKLDFFHLSLGIISCAIVYLFSGDLLFQQPVGKGFFPTCLRFAGYLPYLLKEVFKANFHVLCLVFHPRLMTMIDPQIIRFRSRLHKEMALVTFANSITLTPGTITVSVSVDGDFKVHAIDRALAESLPGEMEERIATVFGEK